ncbi:MAG: MOSC domain-containing protein [Caldilineaceae bacterium]|nr:MOSC domain-containing protein [Caldilineaceae bacterium]
MAGGGGREVVGVGMSEVTVAALHIYPIKSCRGHAVDRVLVTPRGFADDRLMMITDGAGDFLTQREYPRMALIEPMLGEELLTLRAPGMVALDLPIRMEGSKRPVVIWRDRCEAVDQGEGVAAWLSEFLGTEARLMRLADDVPRRVDPQFARSATDQTSFADGYPFLLISEESLADLNRRLATPLPMNRFRPNIVVRGEVPFAEDSWRQIRIGKVTFDLVKPCARCQITTIDQETGAVAGKEPLATFATFRRTPDGKVMFGQNLLSTGAGMIAVGDCVRLEG